MGESTTVPTEGTRLQSRTARRVRRFLGRSWQMLVVAGVVLAIGVLAFLSPGLVRADVRLDEGTVHIAKQDIGKLGVLNAQIEELSNSTTVGDSQFQILQDGHLVLLHGTQSSTLMTYDPARNALGIPVQLPTTATVQLVGGTLMVMNPDNGKVWFGDPDEVRTFDFQKQKAQLEVGEFGAATIAADGTVIGLDIQRSVLVRPSDDGPQETPLPFTVDPDAASIELSAVGRNAVVLDRASGRIWVEGMRGPFEVSGASTARLLAPAPDPLGGENGTKALYATQAGLVAVTSDGPRSLTGNLDAAPIQPLQVGDCVYAAFGEQFVLACRGQEPEIRQIPRVPDDALLVFQVNRSTVVLNDVTSGVAWMLDEDMRRIDDWERVIPPDDSADEELSKNETVIPPNRDQDNRDPIAKDDDDLAARAGRSTILDVLDNDTDPDGDVLTISAKIQRAGVTLETVRGGTGLQITVESDASETATFSYTISDGRGGSDSAEVTVRILPADAATANAAPYKHVRATPLDISRGQSITKRVLMDWRDPDGDSLILVDARLPKGAEDEVTFTPDGQVTFRDIGKTSGSKKVIVRVSDGHVVTDGEMLVSVSDDVVEPIAYGDFATTAAGKSVEVHPLDNDVGANLTLTEVDGGGCECILTPNYREKVFTFTAEKAGTYYVSYKVSNGPVALGLVRIDVREETTNHPPVAAVDVALLPPNGSVMIDPILNDTDEDGDVLVVQSVSQEGGLQVELKRRHIVTITAQYALTAPVTLTYRLSDGKHSVHGSIVVIPTPTTGSDEPQAEQDEVRIRAGATQQVDVMDNDTSPIGLALTLDALVENPLGDRAWIDGDQIRVAIPAGSQASSIAIVYQIRDAEGRIASSRLRVTIVSEDAQNEAPTPRAVEERVLAGTTTRLILPMGGIDPNGDAVRLIGLGSGPGLGRVMAFGDGWLSYEAFPESQGTDVFTYQVIDSLGLVGNGEIRVGVAPAGPQNSPPTGRADMISVRPGRHVQIPALRNDVDIDGDDISYAAAEPVEIEGIAGVTIIEHRDISFVAPLEPGVHTGTYHILDARGVPGYGELQVTIDEKAPLLAPETRDDVVSVSAVVGRDWVEVDVTTNDFDPDGRHEDLRIEVPEQGADEDLRASVTEDGRRVTAPVTQRMQQIRYEVIDSDGLRATGLILLPGRNDSVPVLKDPALLLEATAGQMLSIDYNTYVAGTAGRPVRLTSVDTVSETHGRALPGPERVDYTPAITYEGPASVVFEVIDAVSEGDETAKRAYVSIPITVAPAPNRPADGDDTDIMVARTSPELVGGEPLLKVGPGEGEARLDLLPLFRDADGDSFFFTNFANASGDAAIQWRTSDDKSKLFATTSVNTPAGTELVLNAEVVDAAEGRTAFQIRLQVTSSTRPLATVVADTAEARAGQPVPVAVLLNDKSNLLERPELSVTDAAVINGAGTAKVEGDQVLITPDEGFVGVLTARYTVMDATEDPNRRVDGTIRVTVKDRPSRPGAPRDGITGNGTVTFTYTAGSPNGFEVSSRRAVAVSLEGAEVQSTECKSTTCTVSGLRNAEPYTFQVMETNEAGESDPSPLSAAYTPDVKPNAPAKPEVEFGDKQMTVSWQPPSWEDPENPGSTVDRYTVTLLDGAGNQVGVQENLPADPTSHTWTGLENGTRYRFRVLAGNKAGESPSSEMSDADWPAGPPAAPGSITATATQNPLGGAFEVTFPASGIANNGDPVKQFVVTPITESGAATDKARTVAFTGAASQTVLLEGLGQVRYRFSVQAENKAGPGAETTTTSWQVAWELPKLTNVSHVVTDGAITVSSDSSFADRAEANPVKEYSLNGGTWLALPADGRISGLTNGKLYDVSLRVRVDGSLASEPVVLRGLMPKSDIPRWPAFLPEQFIYTGEQGGLIVLLGRPKDLVESGGWDLAGYEFRCASLCTVSAWTGSNSFKVPSRSIVDGTQVFVAIAHRDDIGRQTTTVATLQEPFRGTWDPGSRSFSFTLRYVSGASCTLTAASVVPGAPGFTQTWAQGSGGTSLAPAPVILPDGITPASVGLSCTADNLKETFKVS